jgi:hypothetical protein
VIDGGIIERDPKPWEGLLIVKGGVPTLLRADKQKLDAGSLLELIGPHGSSIQGHLLVDGDVQRLKPSSALRRRAIATRADGSFFLVESQVALPLAEFAADLKVLGARYALNLDMGNGARASTAIRSRARCVRWATITERRPRKRIGWCCSNRFVER